MSPILGIYASQISGHLWEPQGAYESIQTYTVGAGGSSGITFSSIPSTYKHLQLRFIGRISSASAYAQGLNMQFNSDTGTNYAYHYLVGNSGAGGNTTGASAATTQNQIQSVGMLSTTGMTASTFGSGIIDILDYANTSKYKTSRSLGGTETNSTSYYNYVTLSSGLWQSTSAISSIYLWCQNGSLQQYSQIALYGIK